MCQFARKRGDSIFFHEKNIKEAARLDLICKSDGAACGYFQAASDSKVFDSASSRCKLSRKLGAVSVSKFSGVSISKKSRGKMIFLQTDVVDKC